MDSVLLPNRESKPFDASKCFVTLAEIEALISKYEDRLDGLQRVFNYSGKEDRKIGDMIYRTEGQISLLKDMRHMAYVNGGYRQE